MKAETECLEKEVVEKTDRQETADRINIFHVGSSREISANRQTTRM